MIIAISAVSLAHLQSNLGRLPLSQEERQRRRYPLTILFGEIAHRYCGIYALYRPAEVVCENVGNNNLDLGARSHERLEEDRVLVEYSIHVDKVGLVVVAPIFIELIRKLNCASFNGSCRLNQTSVV